MAKKSAAKKGAVWAVIVAGGSSRRMGFNKLSADLDGRPVLAWSVGAFNDLRETTQEQLQKLITEGPADAKYRAFYDSYMDEATVETLGLAPLKADLAVLEVEGHGSLDEQRAAGAEIDPEEETLMMRALEENSVIVAQMTALYD